MHIGHYYNLRHAFGSIVWGDSTNASSPNGASVNARGETGVKDAVKETTKQLERAGGEGWKGLYCSFPITVMTNVPYGMVMMTTNE